MTPDERRKARYRRYNQSEKGRARDERYEARHPERKQRWSELMRIKANRN